MVYSNQVHELLEVSEQIARDMNSEYICPSHIVKSALRYDNIVTALADAGVNVNALRTEIDEECENCTKLSASRIERYRLANVERKVRMEMQTQCLTTKADNLAENSSWSTGWIEVSHLIGAFVTLPSCSPVFTNHLCNDGNGNFSAARGAIDALIAQEAEEKNARPVSMDLNYPNGGGAAPNQAKNSKNAQINEFCRDLVAAAQEDNKPFIGRTSEVAALMQCLERRDKPNAILVGAPGVGKTDIVRGLAKKLAENEVPEQLRGISLFSVDVPAMLAGSEYRGSFEKRLKETIEKACQQNRPILFFDEIHTVLGAGKGVDSSMDAANILKPYLTEGKIRVIGATTDNEFRQHVEKDAAFMRRFQKIDVSEPTAEETVGILNGVRPAYEDFHKISITAESIKAAVNLSVKHMHDRFLPDKAIDIIDQTCARVKLSQGKKITTADIETTVSTICKIPAQTLQKDEMEKVRGLDKRIKSKVFGQDEAVDKITEAIQMAKAGLGDDMKPIGSFLFVGPSGVGKTELAKQLAVNLGIDFIRFDMSEYGEAHSVAKFIGAPAGYVGYDDGGILVEKVRKQPNSVVLFDEIEKAHPDVYKIFLQMLDYGMVTDSKGRKADFRNTVIIMTSNAGNSAMERPKLGFGEKTALDRKSVSMNAVADLMPPELRGRITSTVVFSPLNDEVSKLVVNKELKALTAKLKAKKISVQYSDATIAEIIKRGVSTQYGAREIQKVIDRDIKVLFVKAIVSGKAAENYLVDIKDGNFVISEVAKEKKQVKAH